ncbi:MAG: DUF3995 domain-containing protein [Dehalococcoidia bacterium]
MTTTQRTRASNVWAGYAACVWALVFAAMSFYWAVGGMTGIGTQAASIQAAARDPDAAFVAVLWATGVLKVAGAVLALALVRRWGRIIPRRLPRAAAWVSGIGMLLYGGVNFVVGVAVALLRAIDIINAPADTSAFWWHLLLWDPWWMLGGALFSIAALSDQRRTRAESRATAAGRR